MDLPLFVYGTLRSGSDNEFARLLYSASEFVTTGRLLGSLYRIAHYPGWVEDSDGWVVGEVWNLREPASLIEELDRYEGAEYSRVVRVVHTPEGPIDCSVYLYVASIQGKPSIISGDWFAG